jgi:hypothetical protein
MRPGKQLFELAQCMKIKQLTICEKRVRPSHPFGVELLGQ